MNAIEEFKDLETQEPNENTLENLKGLTTQTTTRTIEHKEVSTEGFIKAPSNMIKAFTRAYIEQGFQNAAEAARRAGSTSKNPNQIAFQWLKEPWVQRELQIAKELLAEGKSPLEFLKEEDVISKLVNVYNMALQDKKYEPALKAVELMGKHLGMFLQGSQGITSKTLTLREVQTLELTQDSDRLGHLSSVLKSSKLEPKLIGVGDVRESLIESPKV